MLHARKEQPELAQEGHKMHRTYPMPSEAPLVHSSTARGAQTRLTRSAWLGSRSGNTLPRPPFWRAALNRAYLSNQWADFALLETLDAPDAQRQPRADSKHSSARRSMLPLLDYKKSLSHEANRPVLLAPRLEDKIVTAKKVYDVSIPVPISYS